MISVRSYRTTYLCLKDDSYTGFYTDLSWKEQSTTYLAVLCSVSSPQFNNNEVVKAAHHFFITICVASGSGEMEVIMSVFETVKKIIVEVKDISGDEIQLESRFEEDLEADSLDVVEMIMLIEEEYEFEIPEEIAETLKTVKDVVDYIEMHLAENA